MTQHTLDALAQLIDQEKDALLAEWRNKVRELESARHLDTPALNDHIPDLLMELVAALRIGTDETIAEVVEEGSPPDHGFQRVSEGFDIQEVVAEYNILRGCIHDLADRNNLTLQGLPFHVLNRVFDGSIGSAVAAFATYQAKQVLERREEYLAFVAHDLRTPLNAIALSSRVLEVRLADSIAAQPQSAQMFRALNCSVETLQKLVARVIAENSNLATELGIKVERRHVYLWPLVEALIHDLHPVAGTGSTHLINDVPDDLRVYADAGLLQRVLQNLIANAISYTPNGEIVVSAHAIDDSGSVECSVRDTGAGMASDKLQAVFTKHEHDTEKEGGLGLGLAIVKTFVEAHDGEVTVESELGQGTTFRFTLPNIDAVKS
jgi:signal transduction histidine kinase